MGDVADLMLDGVICEQCGVYLGEGCGYVQLCPACEAETREAEREMRQEGER